MLATLNSKQIVDEIVKDTVKDNDPHDAIQISPEIVLAARPVSVAPALAPDITPRPEPKFAPEPKAGPEPKFSPVLEPPTAVPSLDTGVRIAAGDGPNRRKRSAAGKWLRGAFVTFLFAGGSAAATVAWEKHGDTARQLLAEWTPVLTSLLPSTSQTAQLAAAQAVPPAAQAATDQPVDQTAAQAAADQPASPPAAQVAAAAPAAAQTEATQSVQSMTRDLAAMAQQIETLKASIAELKAGQEQMAREMAKPPAPKPVVEAKPPVDPRARVSALPPRAPVPTPPPVRKPKPVVSHTYMPAYSPAPIAPPPPTSQAAAVPPPAPPVATTQAVADDDGPVVRPPMPLR
ncbi:hypothetical protein [Bradyrhizobium sacchari]|uniref:Uncharacterized protein n=1 Tax=Bradyrhizobium sacchari TaxID=1399419 RepID=A0A560J6S3_9BRAD|nr:hypothetical protein [Bradyrhizobium sacchari]TWB66841.1 hypothetical protein FBZ94_101521 [Bradyrhizobium sacchari]TWB84078.1 hypothetical protein FBZ95_101521 [Bradyrhizobium sacchari]